MKLIKKRILAILNSKKTKAKIAVFGGKQEMLLNNLGLYRPTNISILDEIPINSTDELTNYLQATKI
jgi:hypothetical protein